MEIILIYETTCSNIFCKTYKYNKIKSQLFVVKFSIIFYFKYLRKFKKIENNACFSTTSRTLGHKCIK